MRTSERFIMLRMSDVTRILERIEQRDPVAAEELLPLVSLRPREDFKKLVKEFEEK